MTNYTTFEIPGSDDTLDLAPDAWLEAARLAEAEEEVFDRLEDEMG